MSGICGPQLLDHATAWRESHPWIIWLLPFAGMGVGLVYHLLGRQVDGGNSLLIEEIQDPSMHYDALFPCIAAAFVADQVCSAWGIHHTHYVPGTVGPIDAYRYIGLGIPDIVRSFQEPMLFWDLLGELVFTVTSLGTGFKGGEVTPLFYIGATMGNALAPLGFDHLGRMPWLSLASRRCFASVVVPAEQLRVLTRRNVMWLALSGVTTAGSWIFNYKAIKLGEVSTVALIDEGSVVVALVLAWLLLGRSSVASAGSEKASLRRSTAGAWPAPAATPWIALRRDRCLPHSLPRRQGDS